MGAFTKWFRVGSLTVALAVAPAGVTRAKADAFPWIMTSYRYSYLTKHQKQIYQGAFFETEGYFLYGHTPKGDTAALKQLNGWIDCVQDTRNDRGSKGWSPDLGWVFGKNLHKSVAYVLVHVMEPIICQGYAAHAGTERRALQLYNYSDWKKWSLNDKAIYVAGFLDTEATFQELLKADHRPNHLRGAAITIEATGLVGILSDVLDTKFNRHQPLPWSIARGVGRAHDRVYSTP